MNVNIYYGGRGLVDDPTTGGNVIVNIKESRVAIGSDMASKIMV